MLFLAGISAPGILLAARTTYSYRHPDLSVQPILALIAGLLILIRPKLLNFIVAIYLILIGINGLLHLFR
jgi:hypothetical protein